MNDILHDTAGPDLSHPDDAIRLTLAQPSGTEPADAWVYAHSDQWVSLDLDTVKGSPRLTPREAERLAAALLLAAEEVRSMRKAHMDYLDDLIARFDAAWDTPKA